jgi:hypothetical protein
VSNADVTKFIRSDDLFLKKLFLVSLERWW